MAFLHSRNRLTIVSVMPTTTAREAHDALLLDMPAGARHEACAICAPGSPEREVAEVSETTEDPKVFTEAQHVQLLESAVARETANLTGQIDELENRVEALTSEKSAAEASLTEAQGKLDVAEAAAETEKARADASEAEYATFKTELARMGEVEDLKTERASAVKEVRPDLSEAYFSEDRITRWAEQSAETFEQSLADLKEAAPEGVAAPEVDTSTAAARETAAFKGGASPTGTTGGLRGFLTAAGKGPRSASN